MRILHAAVVAVVVFCAPLTAHADPIFVFNASFEGPDVTQTGYPPTGWTVLGLNADGGGVWDIVDFLAIPGGYWANAGNTPPDGQQIGYLSLGPLPGSYAGLSQFVGETLSTNRTYNLSGFVGHPLGFATGTMYTVSLWAGGLLLGSYTANGPEADFAAFNLSVNGALFPGLVGEQLEIRLESDRAQTGFDMISLEAVPDGGVTALLLGASLAGIGWIRRRTL